MKKDNQSNNLNIIKERDLQTIKEADHAYYDLDAPIMSDSEYDSLRNSYIKRYGSADLNYTPGEASSEFEKFRHPTPVTSLAKWTDGSDEETKFVNKVSELFPVEIQPKYDGLTVVAYPNKDGSCKFVTRGQGGETGEVLPNFIPKYEKEGINLTGYPVRGEVFITPDNFRRLNIELISENKEPMKNMRNAAAGLLRRKERSKYLHLLSYIVYDIPGQDLTPDDMKKLVNHKTLFTFTEGRKSANTESTINDVRKFYDELIKNNNIPVDGVVIKSCQEHSLKKFGFTAHHPKNAFAYKHWKKAYVTHVTNVIWQMGRNKATPVAVVEPVEIDGAVVTRASLHNLEQIKKLGLKIGAKVLIYKANEIIPQIDKVLENGTITIETPVCPSCHQPLKEINGQHFCVNRNCKERISQNIAFLGSKDVLDIAGLSIETARKIMQTYPEEVKSHLQNCIFRLSKADLEKLPGFAKKSAENLYSNIEKAVADVSFEKFIKACCIEGIGSNVGRVLAKEFGTVESLICLLEDKNNAKNRLQQLEGIGPVTADTLVSDDFRYAVLELRSFIKPNKYKQQTDKTTGKFAGKTFALTGKMEHPRSYYVDLIEKFGGKESKTITSKTDYLIIADINSQSSKAKKARQLGIKIIPANQFDGLKK